MWQLPVTVFLTSYLLGSVPWGLIVARARGVDIRQHGSGNIGATNVLRTVGKPWGIAVFALDALKGLASVRLAVVFAERGATSANYAEFYAILAAAACVIGHSFPIWLGFRGGKGVATSAGALLGVVPIAAITIFLVWVIVFRATRYVSLASIVAASALPFTVALLIWLHMTKGVVLLYFTSAMTALVVWRHRSNISRIVAGTEPRFTRK